MNKYKVTMWFEPKGLDAEPRAAASVTVIAESGEAANKAMCAWTLEAEKGAEDDGVLYFDFTAEPAE